MDALIFDCDGVLVDTEKDGHRVAFNLAFQENRIDAHWSETEYGKWLEVGGGKERLTAYFKETGWPEDIEDHDSLVRRLHKAKTAHFIQLIEQGQLPLRPGVARLIDEAIAQNTPIAVCSTSNERSVQSVVDTLLEDERSGHIRIFAGDMAKQKKPHPEIYQLAAEEMKLDPSQCLVVEDSRIGLLAAVGAGMNCIITKSAYTAGEDFSEAQAVYSSLDEGPVTLSSLNACLASASNL